jgi:hypothetical protein
VLSIQIGHLDWKKTQYSRVKRQVQTTGKGGAETEANI